MPSSALLSGAFSSLRFAYGGKTRALERITAAIAAVGAQGRRSRFRPTTFACNSLCLLMTACATTTVETSGAALQRPMCTANGPKLHLALYWEPQWRPDQKEPAAREALAERGIERFVSEHACLSVTELRRL